MESRTLGTATDGQIRAALGAMSAVVAPDAAPPRRGAQLIAATPQGVFGRTLRLDGPVPVVPPDLLPRALGADPALRARAGELVAIAALADAVIEPDRLDLVLDYAAALGIEAAWVGQVADLAAGRYDRALADMVRRNTATFPGLGDPHGDPDLFPYTGRTDADKRVAAAFAGLEAYPHGSFGHAFWVHFRRHGFRFPGQEGAFRDAFAVPHDGLHVLSGYDTSMQGELLVSTFTGGMHGRDALAAHLLPVILQWHVGVEVNGIGAQHGALDPRKFLVAWQRGRTQSVDVLDPRWRFFTVAPRPLEELREAYEIPALADADRASGPEVNVTAEADPAAA
ncbi:hypothetical protein [Tomitella gaofuii]|uniref:hypothetical protein n=1 Tax=Tomitella gaofuii TaxID=2760083 RepID=UPI0015FACAD1|nr:hypothetical protein [Tomitella gaofuii]